MINDDSFTNEVMTQINFETLQPNENIKTNSLKRTIIHYIIATAATIIFMVSGLFQYILQRHQISRNLQNITSLLSHNKL